MTRDFINKLSFWEISGKQRKLKITNGDLTLGPYNGVGSDCPELVKAFWEISEKQRKLKKKKKKKNGRRDEQGNKGNMGKRERFQAFDFGERCNSFSCPPRAACPPGVKIPRGILPPTLGIFTTGGKISQPGYLAPHPEHFKY